MQRLIDIGFQSVGRWMLKENDLCFELDTPIASTNVLYAFVSNDTILYIGKTTRTLRNRMRGYERPGRTQLTNLRNHANLKALLAQASLVEIYALPDHGLLQYGAFQINLAAGLEDSLIKTMKPVWNNRCNDTYE